MHTHTYMNFRYGVLHSADYRCTNGHMIHSYFETIFYDSIVWC